jgi:hypothetical protein
MREAYCSSYSSGMWAGREDFDCEEEGFSLRGEVAEVDVLLK